MSAPLHLPGTALAIAVRSSSSVTLRDLLPVDSDSHSWLTSGLKMAKEDEFEAAIEDMRRIDMVIHNTLMEVYTQNIVPLRGDLNLVG